MTRQRVGCHGHVADNTHPLMRYHLLSPALPLTSLLIPNLSAHSMEVNMEVRTLLDAPLDAGEQASTCRATRRQ